VSPVLGMELVINLEGVDYRRDDAERERERDRERECGFLEVRDRRLEEDLRRAAWW
jgi:hypothetical protein